MALLQACLYSQHVQLTFQHSNSQENPRTQGTSPSASGKLRFGGGFSLAQVLKAPWKSQHGRARKKSQIAQPMHGKITRKITPGQRHDDPNLLILAAEQMLLSSGV